MEKRGQRGRDCRGGLFDIFIELIFLGGGGVAAFAFALLLLAIGRLMEVEKNHFKYIYTTENPIL